jgi:hypothetical protein
LYQVCADEAKHPDDSEQYDRNQNDQRRAHDTPRICQYRRLVTVGSARSIISIILFLALLKIRESKRLEAIQFLRVIPEYRENPLYCRMYKLSSDKSKLHHCAAIAVMTEAACMAAPADRAGSL